MVETRKYDLDLIFQALSDPTRRAILKRLSRHERTITEVGKPFPMSLAAISKHVKVLERARLIHRQRRGSFSYLNLNGEAMFTADQWIERYRKFWEIQLSSLKQFIEKETS